MTMTMQETNAFAGLAQSKEALKERLREFQENQTKADIDPLNTSLIVPCSICRLNTDAKDFERGKDDCPHLGDIGNPGFICPDLQVKKNTEHHKLAKYLMQIYEFKTFQDTEEVLVYQDGIYQTDGETVIKKDCQKLLGETKNHYVSEVLATIQRSTYIQREQFDKDPNLLTLKNGILDLENRVLNDFTPIHLSTIKLPVIYDPQATCPNIERFLSEIVDADDIELLKEFVAYLLEPSYFIRKSFMLVGGGSNGKSTFLELLNHFLGPENCSHEPLQQLIYNRFSSARLYGKLLNSFNDISNAALKSTGIFKGLCGADTIRGENKFKNPFYFKNKAKLIFSTNRMPKTNDDSDAFYERWIIINFPQIFDDSNPDTDKALLEKLTTPQELSGLLNIALDRLQDLRQKQKFSSSQTVAQTKEYYKKLSDPIYAFLEDECIKDHVAFITKADLYAAFNKYCEQRKLTKMSQMTFTKDLKKHVNPREERKTILGKRKTCWTGIRLMSAKEKEEKAEKEKEEKPEKTTLEHY